MFPLYTDFLLFLRNADYSFSWTSKECYLLLCDQFMLALFAFQSAAIPTWLTINLQLVVGFPCIWLSPWWLVESELEEICVWLRSPAALVACSGLGPKLGRTGQVFQMSRNSHDQTPAQQIGALMNPKTCFLHGHQMGVPWVTPGWPFSRHLSHQGSHRTLYHLGTHSLSPFPEW